MPTSPPDATGLPAVVSVGGWPGDLATISATLTLYVTDHVNGETSFSGTCARRLSAGPKPSRCGRHTVHACKTTGQSMCL